MTDLKELVGKEVKVYLKNKFFYQGKLLSFDKESMKIRDRYKGIIFLNLDTVSSIIENDR